MVGSVLGIVQRDFSPTQAALLREVEGLAATVSSARADIAAMGADEVAASHIPAATDELETIVEHTAWATGSILESCEHLERLTSRLPSENTQALHDCVTRIHEACSVQDITSQRITKVVAALQAIESKVAHVIEVFAPNGVVATRVVRMEGSLRIRAAERPAIACQRDGSIRCRRVAGQL